MQAHQAVFCANNKPIRQSGEDPSASFASPMFDMYLVVDVCLVPKRHLCEVKSRALAFLLGVLFLLRQDLPQTGNYYFGRRAPYNRHSHRYPERSSVFGTSLNSLLQVNPNRCATTEWPNLLQ
jgi:hypothetical protein